MTCPDLTLLCVTRNEPHAQPFIDRFARVAHDLGATLLLAVDGDTTPLVSTAQPVETVFVESAGFIESVLDDLIASTPADGYILRLDDDERMSSEMVDWLAAGAYRAAPHWAFRRANLWPDEDNHIVNAPLWPDLQTRCSLKHFSGGRTTIHQGSPYGTGMIAPVLIEHHKFLVRPAIERKALVERYESLQPGAGSEFVMFSLPELYPDDLDCRPVPVMT